MKQNNKFITSRIYSGIPELQEEALDTYEVIKTENGVIITYICECISKPPVKEKVVAPISFSLAKDLAVFLSENACREKCWIDILNDLIIQNANIVS